MSSTVSAVIAQHIGEGGSQTGWKGTVWHHQLKKNIKANTSYFPHACSLTLTFGPEVTWPKILRG